MGGKHPKPTLTKTAWKGRRILAEHVGSEAGNPLLYGKGKNRVLLHPFRPAWFVINETGHCIASQLFSGLPLHQVAQDLSDRYGIPQQKAAEDILAFEAGLHNEGFLGNTAGRPAQRSPAPRSLFIHLTDRCNLSCLHCYTHKIGRLTSDLPAQVVFRLLDELMALGGTVVTLSGGEPFLHTALRDIISHARPELDVRLLTNGTLLDASWATFLAEKGVSVQVSVDGSCPEVHDAIRGRGTFKKAVRAVEMLQKAGLSDQVNLSATVMRQNRDDLPSILELAHRMGVPLARFLPLRRKGTAQARWQDIGEGWSREEEEAFYAYSMRFGRDNGRHLEVSCGLSGFMLFMPEGTTDGIWCPVGRQLAVDVNGDAYPCVAMMIPEFLLGNVRQQHLNDLFQSRGMKAICRALVDRRQRIDKCARCTWRNLCQAGCMGLALEHKGTIWDTDDFCEYREKLYREAFDRILATEDGDGETV